LNIFLIFLLFFLKKQVFLTDFSEIYKNSPVFFKKDGKSASFSPSENVIKKF